MRSTPTRSRRGPLDRTSNGHDDDPIPELPTFEELVPLLLSPPGSAGHTQIETLLRQLGRKPRQGREWPWSLLVRDMVYQFTRYTGQSDAVLAELGRAEVGRTFNLEQLRGFHTFWRETLPQDRQEAESTEGLSWHAFYGAERERRSARTALMVKRCRDLLKDNGIEFDGYEKAKLPKLLRHLKLHNIPSPVIGPTASTPSQSTD